MLVLHDALATGKQFGRQFILPYGPMGFIATSVYDPRTFGILLASRCLLGTLVFLPLWRSATSVRWGLAVTWVWVAAIIGLMAASPDHYFPIVSVLLLLSYFWTGRRLVTMGVIALVIALAVGSLAKVNFFMQSAAAVGAVALDQLFHRRSRGWVIPAVFIGTMGVLYVAAGQSLAHVGVFLSAWAQLSAGHVDAVSRPGAASDVLAYLVESAGVLGLIASAAWRRFRWTAALPLGALLVIALLLYKHSFIRQDFAHATIGPMVMLAAAILFCPVVWEVGGRIRRAACIVAVTLAAVVSSSSLTGYRAANLPAYAGQTAMDAIDQLGAAYEDVAHRGHLRSEWEAARAQLRFQNPLNVAEIHGAVDIYPHRQDVLFAYGLDYRPRPATQGLLATAPALSERDAEHLASSEAPQTILFDIDPIDEHLPSLVDGLSWPNLLTRYDVVDASGRFLILARAASPRTYRFVPVAKLTGTLGRTLLIPDAAGPLWARIRLKPKALGRVLSAVYRPPIVAITLGTRVPNLDDEGEPAFYRLLPSLAERGFLLSPLIVDRRDFFHLASATWPSDSAPNDVSAITIDVDGDSFERWFEPTYEVELDRLDFSHQNFTARPALR